jgi:hypothetical protein
MLSVRNAPPSLRCGAGDSGGWWSNRSSTLQPPGLLEARTPPSLIVTTRPSSVQEEDYARDASDQPPSEDEPPAPPPPPSSSPPPPPPPPAFAFRRPPPRTLRQDETEADVHILAVALMREGVDSEAPDPSLAEQGCQLVGHLSFQRRSAQTRLLAAGAAEVLCGVVAHKLSGSTRMVLLSLRALLNLSTCADGQVRRLRVRLTCQSGYCCDSSRAGGLCVREHVIVRLSAIRRVSPRRYSGGPSHRWRSAGARSSRCWR